MYPCHLGRGQAVAVLGPDLNLDGNDDTGCAPPLRTPLLTGNVFLFTHTCSAEFMDQVHKYWQSLINILLCGGRFFTYKRLNIRVFPLHRTPI